MSTIGYESWAVDLANVGAVYPFQGAEVLMVIVGVAFWLGWHVVQSSRESAELESQRKAFDKSKAASAIDRY